METAALDSAHSTEAQAAPKKVSQEVKDEVAAVKLAQEVQVIEGEAALALIRTASVDPLVGGSLSVYG